MTNTIFDQRMTMRRARLNRDNRLLFTPCDDELSFNRTLQEGVSFLHKPQSVLDALIEQLRHMMTYAYAHTRGILTKIEFRRALEFFHLIKIILHDDRLREDKLSNAAKRMFLEDCCNRLRELKAPTELRKLTAGEWMRGNTLTQNWKFISQDWNKLAPIIMGTFIAIAARKDGNKDLRIPLKDKRLFYLIQQNMLNDRWSHNGSPDLKAAPRNLPASRTTLAWEVAKHIWSAYGIQLQARAVEMRAEEAQRKAEEASRLAQRAKYHAERGFKRRKMDQRDWHADFSARTKQAKHGN